MKDKNNYYITSAIAYASVKPHMGNVYELVLADAIARYRRNQGLNVLFQTGTDEHGQKIEGYAQKNNETPQQYVNKISEEIKSQYDIVDVSYDNFVRTTDPYHIDQVQKIFKKLFDQGDLYKGTYEGWYSKAEESYFTDTQVKEGNVPDYVTDLERQKEECYFFNMSKYQDRLIQHIKDNPDFIQPESRKNEMLNNFLKEPLLDLAVSRTSFKWGIPVGFDEGHVIYVWIDALTNYITGIGYDVDGNHSKTFKEFWPADVHLIGKDILRFHTIYWPILLMALDIELPKQIFGHPWLLTNGNKMSKSLNNVVYTDDVVELFGVDGARYLMLSQMPFDKDGNLTFEIMVERINTDLANITGNLINRSISMVNKYFDGTINHNSVITDEDSELIEMASSLLKNVDKKMDELRVQDAIALIINTYRRANKYIDETQPWILAKDESQSDRLQTVLYNLLETIRIGAIALNAFIPDTSNKILDQLNTSFRSHDDGFEFGKLELNNKVTDKPEILFQRVDKEELLEKIEETKEPVTKLDSVSFNDFKKIDMQTGTIKEVIKHPKADKLYIIQVDLGHNVVQVVSGLVDHFSAEELLNQNVIVVANLEPVELRGVKSNGMILAAKDSKGKLTLVQAVDAENGITVS